MDPLSFTASLCTVIAAAGASAKILKKVRSLRYLPTQMCALLNEVEELRVMLRIMEDLCQDDDEEDVQRSLWRLLKRAESSFNELDELLQSTLLKTRDEKTQDDEGPGKPRTASFLWIKKQGQLTRLQSEIRDVRVSIETVALALNSANQLCEVSSLGQRMNFNINRLVVMQTDLNHRQEQFEDFVDTFREQNMSTSGNAWSLLKKDTVAGESARFPGGSSSSLLRIPDGRDISSSFDEKVVSLHTTRICGSQCPVECRCRCHIGSIYNLPRPLRAALGTLFIGYSGRPIFGNNTCDDGSCQRRNGYSVHVTYYFPVWFMANVISINYARSYPDGPTFALKVSRIRPKSSDVFLAASLGDSGWLQSLFQQGLASPFDVAAEDGQSVLQHSLDASRSKTSETTIFLIRQGADPYHKHHHSTSAADGFWRERHRLAAADAEPADEPAEIKRILDDPDFTDSLQLSPIHKITFGLSKLDLDQYLSLTTAEIDAADCTGKGPLHWAILRSDLDTATKLINWGADVNVRDFMRRTPLCYAVWLAQGVRFCQLVLAASPDVSSRDVYGQTPLLYACYRHDNVGIRCCEILLTSTDIDPNASRWDGYTALHLAVQHGSVEQIKLLVHHGAFLDLETENGWTPLIIAIKANNHVALVALIELGAKVSILNQKGLKGVPTAVVMAAERGDLRTMEILGNVDFSSVEETARNEAVKVGKELFVTRKTEKDVELSRAFDSLMKNLGYENL